MADGKTIFRRIRGRIVPIHTTANAAQGAVRAVSVKRAIAVGALSGGVAAGMKNKKVQTNKLLKYTSTGLAVASGILGAATFTSRGKSFWGGIGGGLALDAASSSSNFAAHAGRGNTRNRVKAGIQHEAFNTLLGNAVFGAGLLAIPKNRAAIKSGGMAVLNFFRRVK